jgi:deazaflavin-dependent oxidoreductase (nitroreductase family)
MNEIQQVRAKPRGLLRWFFRLPLWFYRLGLGWLLGGRFLLLNHIGRKSGLPRQTVLEVVHYDPASDTYTIAAGFGPQSDWYLNLRQSPQTTIQVKRRKLAVTADLLEPNACGDAMVRYAHEHPQAARNLSRLLGYKVTQGTADEYRHVGHSVVRFVDLRPSKESA